MKKSWNVPGSIYVFDFRVGWEKVRICLACYTRRNHGIGLEGCTYLTGLIHKQKLAWPDKQAKIMGFAQKNVYVHILAGMIKK
jgi:hypothetical protein